jgi:hypothetical protein
VQKGSFHQQLPHDSKKSSDNCLVVNIITPISIPVHLLYRFLCYEARIYSFCLQKFKIYNRMSNSNLFTFHVSSEYICQACATRGIHTPTLYTVQVSYNGIIYSISNVLIDDYKKVRLERFRSH